MAKKYIILIIPFLLWGSYYVVCKSAAAFIPPVTILTCRYILASLFVLPFALKKGMVKIQARHWPYFLLFGLVCYALGVGMNVYSVKFLDASLASLINSMMPVAISALAVPVLKEKMSPYTIAGLILSIVGVAVVINVKTGEINVLGLVLAVAAVITWSLMSVLTRKITEFYSAEQISLVSTALGIIPCAIFSVFELKAAPAVINTESVLSVLYLGLICTGMANMFWSISLKSIKANICSAFYPVQAFSSAVLGVVFLQEPLTVNFYIGSVLLFIGVIINVCGEAIWSRIKAAK